MLICGPCDATNVAARVASLLLDDVDGRALRRVVYDVDARPLVDEARRAVATAVSTRAPPSPFAAGPRERASTRLQSLSLEAIHRRQGTRMHLDEPSKRDE